MYTMVPDPQWLIAWSQVVVVVPVMGVAFGNVVQACGGLRLIRQTAIPGSRRRQLVAAAVHCKRDQSSSRSDLGLQTRRCCQRVCKIPDAAARFVRCRSGPSIAKMVVFTDYPTAECSLLVAESLMRGFIGYR